MKVQAMENRVKRLEYEMIKREKEEKKSSEQAMRMI